jgi:hypothetical protein
MVALQSSVATACSVPVFRYALEHWQPDPYVAFVFYRGELTPEQTAVVESMQTKSVDGAPIANLFVKSVNLDTDLEQDENLRAIWEANQSESLPHLVLQSPPKWGPSQTVWSGNLSAGNSKLLMESPVRKKIKQGLISGDSIVWVLLECGDKQKDDLAFALLNTEMKLLQAKLKLPEVVDADRGELTVAPESLKIAFSAVRVSKQDVAEKPLVEMLLGVEEDLRDEEYRNRPMVFPVFGRGRALYALVGDGITSDLIEETGQFLTGACQCTVKQQNPGVDLLMNVEWDRFVEPTEALDAALPPLAGFSGFGAPEKTGEDLVVEPGKVDETGVSPKPELKPAAKDEQPKPAEAIETAPVKKQNDVAAVNYDPPAETLLSRNLRLVLLLVVGAVVIATLILKPRTT